jgi:small-conductance mechanosensitive channel
MQVFRLAESTELNNAWIVGIVAACALVVIWLVTALSKFVLRQGAQFLRIRTLQSFTDDYGRRLRLVAVVASFAVAIAGAAVLAYTLSQHKDLQPTIDQVLGQITLDAVIVVARITGVMCLFLFAFYLLKAVSGRVIARVRGRMSPRELGERQQMFLERFFTHLPSAVNLSLTYALLGVAAETFRLPGPLQWFLFTTVYVLLLLAGGRALVMLAHFLSERLLANWGNKVTGSKLEEYYAALRRLLPVVQRSVEAIVYVSVATLLVHRFERLEPFAPYGPLLIRVISMFLAASVLVEVVRVLVARLLLAAPSAAEDSQRRRVTFVGLIQNIARYIIYFCVGMMVLEDLGVNPTPILAGAGIVGLTVGLGAQKIVQDLLAGLLLLFEDQILHGDYIRIRDTEGVVEQVSLRITRVRDRFGRLHILRNGEVQNVINYSRGWTLAVVEFTVTYENDLATALRVIADVAARLPATMQDKVIEAPQVKGIETIGAAGIVVRIETRVAPGAHYDVKRTLNRMLIDGFNARQLKLAPPNPAEPKPAAVPVGPEVPGPGAARTSREGPHDEAEAPSG